MISIHDFIMDFDRYKYHYLNASLITHCVDIPTYIFLPILYLCNIEHFEVFTVMNNLVINIPVLRDDIQNI